LFHDASNLKFKPPELDSDVDGGSERNNEVIQQRLVSFDNGAPPKRVVQKSVKLNSLGNQGNAFTY